VELSFAYWGSVYGRSLMPGVTQPRPRPQKGFLAKPYSVAMGEKMIQGSGGYRRSEKAGKQVIMNETKVEGVMD